MWRKICTVSSVLKRFKLKDYAIVSIHLHYLHISTDLKGVSNIVATAPARCATTQYKSIQSN